MDIYYYFVGVFYTILGMWFVEKKYPKIKSELEEDGFVLILGIPLFVVAWPLTWSAAFICFIYFLLKGKYYGQAD